ncbi:MAG: HEAT repeat domain-containing protein [Spirochaetes bacterium]|nr:HEAT repeat domain-containing protein [Spirochaetota bacterium]
MSITAYCLILALLATGYTGCATLRKSDLVRTQKQRSAAKKYALGNWMDRRDAVHEIVNYYGKDKNDLVIGTLMVASNDLSSAVRREAVEGLAKIGNKGALDTIKKIASDEKEKNVRWYSLRALRTVKGSAEDPSAADVYIKGTRSNDWLIREESIRGILAMDDAIIRKKCIPTIIRLMKDPSSSVALTTFRELKTRDPLLYQAITGRFQACGEFDYSMLEATLTALDGYRLDQKTREKVIDLLVHHNTAIRLLALRVLKKDKTLAEQKK